MKRRSLGTLSEHETETTMSESTAQPIRTCKACRYWKGDRTLDKLVWGQCRRGAPTLVLSRDVVHPATASHWPPVASDGWCGEYAALVEGV